MFKTQNCAELQSKRQNWSSKQPSKKSTTGHSSPGILNTPLSPLRPLPSFPSSRADRLVVNRSSQTAYDIAKFWGHTHIGHLLVRTDDRSQRVLATTDPSQESYFSAEPLERLSERRSDAAWQRDQQNRPDSVFLIFSHLSPLVRRLEPSAGPGVGRLVLGGSHNGRSSCVLAPTD